MWHFGMKGTENKIIEGHKTEVKKEGHQPRKTYRSKQSKYGGVCLVF